MRIIIIVLSLLVGCTMPLPVSSVNTPQVGNTFPNISNGNSDSNTPIIPLEGITLKQGLYNNQIIDYIDLNFCIGDLLQDPTCANTLSNSTANEYIFKFSDGKEVPGQKPVFSTIPGMTNNSPFHVIFSVTVPDSYEADSIRSEEDVFASQFTIKPLEVALNHPVVQDGETILEKTINKAWFKGQLVSFLDLGSIPYSSRSNQLGTSPVYFLFNSDGTSELPSNPRPVFATVPGDLRYSPVRQVFVAISENEVTDIVDDPSVAIRSQDELLNAVNNGVFKLSTTRIFFNYSVSEELSNLLPKEPQQYDFIPGLNAPLPVLQGNSHYALWYKTKSNQQRVIGRFQYRSDGKMIKLNTNVEFNEFAIKREVALHISDVFLTVESSEESKPAELILLSSSFSLNSPMKLEMPFLSDLKSNISANFMLATPTNGNENQETSGIWFVRRTDQSIKPPITSQLESGVPLKALPGNWGYRGWIRTQILPEVWMSTGFFKDPNASDDFNDFSGKKEGYPFAGEDFLVQAPPLVQFPFNLVSSGDSRVVVSLEPGMLQSEKPFIGIYQSDISKLAKPYTNLDMANLPLNPPVMQLIIKEKS